MTWSRVKPRSATHGAAHDKARKQWAAVHDPSTECARSRLYGGKAAGWCGKPLGPMGPHLHLDHDDIDKRVYIGFSCAKDNLRAAALRGNAVQKAKRRGQPPPSQTFRPLRDW